MKKIILVLMVLSLMGCAALNYQAPDGTKVTYSRLLTSSDVIKGKVGEASIESRGQQTIDPAVLQAIINILGTVR